MDLIIFSIVLGGVVLAIIAATVTIIVGKNKELPAAEDAVGL